MTKNSCFRDFGAGRLCKVRAIVSSNSAFCGFAVHLHSDVARILSSNPRICGIACRFAVDLIETITQNSCFCDFGLKRCRKPILLLISRHRLLPQTHILSNFAASAFRVRVQIFRNQASLNSYYCELAGGSGVKKVKKTRWASEPF